MSYDLMVFEPTAAPRGRAEFMKWYAKQTEWSEDHDYDDPKVSSPALQRWFGEMIEVFPPMNGPLAGDDDDDNPHVTDHCVGREVIYSAFAWSCAEEAYSRMRDLALKHRVGFFDASSEDGEILFPDRRDWDAKKGGRPWWRLW